MSLAFAVPRRRWMLAAALVVLPWIGYRLWRAATEGWDFETFYAAALALRRGLDPYDLATLSTVLGKPVEFAFLYPPATVFLFMPWTLLGLPLAKLLWLLLGAISAALLVVVWRRFVPEAPLAALLVAALFAFDAPMLWTLRAGNVELPLQLLLWIAFACYAAGRRAAFVALLLPAALFKLLPIAFLALLFVRRPARRDRLLATASLLLFLGLVFLPVALLPAWARGFLAPAMERPIAPANPSLLGGIDGLLGSWSATRAGTVTALGLWALAAAGILGSSGDLLRAARREPDLRRDVSLACLLYALIAPRLIVYSYLLLVVPALDALGRIAATPRARSLALGALCVQGALQWWRGDVDWRWAAYLPWWCALALWGVQVWSARAARRSRAAGAAVVVALLATGCAHETPPPASCRWVLGRPLPAFDPGGPPDPSRWALERLLTRGLVARDSSGRIVPAAAGRVEVSADGLTYTFHLRHELRFSDGSPCTAENFRAALERGLERDDRVLQSWLLGAVQNVDRVRAGKPLPRIGIDLPDPLTAVLQLTRPDSTLLEKLALPGVCDPWKAAGVSWNEALGIGPYRVVGTGAEPPGRLTLVRNPYDPFPASGPDTLRIRAVPGASLVRAALRREPIDLVWPLPPGLLDQPLPEGFKSVVRGTQPPRRLVLVLRPDRAPTSKAAARQALAHGINLRAALRELGPSGRPVSSWLGGAPFDVPPLDPALVRRELSEGRLGRSFHVALAYDADGPAAEVASDLQAGWAGFSIDVELVPRRGEAWRKEMAGGGSQLLLVEIPGLLSGEGAELQALQSPASGAGVAGFRTGWRLRDFDDQVRARGDSAAIASARVRLDQELIALPLADLHWTWVERLGREAAPFDPRLGPSCASRAPAVQKERGTRGD